jgi:hypothetical protein
MGHKVTADRCSDPPWFSHDEPDCGHRCELAQRPVMITRGSTRRVTDGGSEKLNDRFPDVNHRKEANHSLG